MNKLKALLIAGLLSMTSVSFAAGVVFPGPTTTVGSSGSIDLNVIGDNVTVGGFFDNVNAGSVFYDLSIAEGSVLAINVPSDVTDLNGDAVTIAIYDALASVGTLGDALFVGSNSLAASLTHGAQYFIEFTGTLGDSFNADVAAVPVPAAGILFASALFGAGALGRRKKKAKTNAVVNAFARAS